MKYSSEFITPCLLITLIIGVISYLIGSVNFSIILSRVISGKDIRESGSGNAGATNMLRTHGKKMAIIVLLLDVLKGIVCVGLTRFYIYDLNNLSAPDIYTQILTLMSLPYIAAVCVVLGHNFPIFFGFKGGKGVATSLGVVMMLDWKVGLIIAVASIAVMAITKYVSLGSIIGGALYILIEGTIVLIRQPVNIVCFVCVIVLGGLLILRHHANIGRLLKGTENKLSFSKKEN